MKMVGQLELKCTSDSMIGHLQSKYEGDSVIGYLMKWIDDWVTGQCCVYYSCNSNLEQTDGQLLQCIAFH